MINYPIYIGYYIEFFYFYHLNELNIKLDQGTNTLLLIMKGNIKICNQIYKEKSLVVFDREPENLIFLSSKNFQGLLLNGDPIYEPLVSYGPFVMNSKEEIDLAISDYQNGKMGEID